MSLATNSTRPDVSVLVPAKDEADNLAEFVRLTREALLPLPVFIAIIQTQFIRGEEQMLTGIFGQQYTDYQARVRRWL